MVLHSKCLFLDCGGNLQGSGTIVINNLTSVVSILSKIEVYFSIVTLNIFFFNIKIL